tara:strand:- start:7510 stop:7992 length:483 start_codon:yes stop_codon:yes gene_type:complete
MNCEEITSYVLACGPIPRLTAASLKQWRSNNLPEHCPITGEPIYVAHADHCHQDGRMRGVIEGAANTFLGKIENHQASRMARFTKRTLPDKLRLVADYIEKESPLLWHPNHGRKVKNRFKRLKREKQLALLTALGVSSEELTNSAARADAFVNAVTKKEK